MKTSSKIFTALIMLFLFAPIIILLVFSFNESKSLSVFSNFSFNWYRELLKDTETLKSVRNTLVLALSASVISTVLGTAAAVGINKLKNKYARVALDTVTNIPMINPDILTGISLMLMFVFVGHLFGLNTSLSFWTLLIAHITFCLPYVILQVLPKLEQMDKSLPEAAMDLGCTPLQAFFKATLPEITSGVITGLIMAFTLSLDDFVITYFTTGNSFQTLPIRIYNMTKKTVTPKMYALATIIFFVILALLIITNVIDKDDTKERKKTSKINPKYVYMGTSFCILALIILIIVIGNRADVRTLNVYNWGEYISDGSDDTLDTIKAFEAWHEEKYGEKIRVNYSTFASNEDMYAKLSSGSVSYDIVIPSDYMIKRMKDEGMLLPLNFDNIPNYCNIADSFHGLYYDENDEYTVPYTYGVVGIIYNGNVVDEEDANDWDLMWNEKYSGNILQFNNSRDGFATAQYYADIDVNSENKADWDAALDLMKKQAPLVKSYVMDEIYNMMESGEAAIAAYYAGDYFTMLDSAADDVDLCFYYPERTNYFVDAMCIPSCCEDKELAERFIDYMLTEEPAIANAEYIYYASPNKIVYESEDYQEEMGEEAMEILYFNNEVFGEMYNKYAYRNLSSETLDYVNSLWETLKIN